MAVSMKNQATDRMKQTANVRSLSWTFIQQVSGETRSKCPFQLSQANGMLRRRGPNMQTIMQRNCG